MFTNTTVPVKTDAGRREMQARQLKLPPMARVLLIAIDGHATVGELRESFTSLGDVVGLLGTLEAQGLLAANGADGGHAPNKPAANAAATPASTLSDAAQRFIHAQRFMNETVVEALGLRAFLFTLKLERCSNVAELRELVGDYDRMIAKARDASLLKAYHARLDHWLR